MTSPLGRIGRYELLARLGAGGMGEIFLARAKGAGGFEKRVVIKRILPHLARDPGFVERFVAEGRLVVQLRHAGIAQVLDMGEEDGVFYLAMEHVDGRDLSELVKLARTGGVALPLPVALAILCRLLEALDHAHRATDADGAPMGIIHRDVSPSNVMVSRAGEVKLLDFGIARATERLHTTETGAIRGKFSYMSPQQAAGEELDARSDLFSVGVLAWELLAGARPFDAPSDLLTLDRIRFHDPGPLRAVAPEVPEEVAGVVERLLAKDPADRFQSADEAQRALLGHLQRLTGVVLSRDIAEWVDAVLATLPPAMRDRPAAGLSLDEALLLGLDSPPRGATATAGTPVSRPPTPTGTAATPAGAPAAVPIAAARPSEPALPVTAEVVGPRSRRTFMVALVTLNLALLVAVAWLLLRDGPTEASPAGEVAVETASAARGAEGDPGAAVRPGDAGGDGLGAVTPEEASAETHSPADTVDPLSPVEAPTDGDAAETGGPGEDAAEPVEPVEPAKIVAGAEAGELLAAFEPVFFAEPFTLLIRVTPTEAQITVDGLGTSASPRRVRARPGTTLRGVARAPGYRPRGFTHVVERDDGIHLTLTPIPKGHVTFRYFPAQGTRVLIDGVPVDTATNVVRREVTAGRHRLELVSADGTRHTRTFEVEEGKLLNLGTIDVGRQD